MMTRFFLNHSMPCAASMTIVPGACRTARWRLGFRRGCDVGLHGRRNQCSRDRGDTQSTEHH